MLRIRIRIRSDVVGRRGQWGGGQRRREFASDTHGVVMTAILMCVFGWATRRGTSGWSVEIFGGSIVARRVVTRQKGGVDGFD
jgi:hypothetical protein